MSWERGAMHCIAHFPATETNFRSYRAPELLFGSRAYNALSLDRWALGVVFASFFTSISSSRPPSPFSDDSAEASLPPIGPLHRLDLFEGGFSDFTLIGSIFKVLGTPDTNVWPVSRYCCLWRNLPRLTSGSGGS